MATAFVVVALNIARHLAGPLPQRLHEPQVISALPFRLIMQMGSGQRRQLALTAQTHLGVLAHHFLPRVHELLVRGFGQKIPLHHQLADL